MNENENDTKPEEGEAAAPVTEENTHLFGAAAAPETPEPTETPAVEATSEPEPEVSQPEPESEVLESALEPEVSEPEPEPTVTEPEAVVPEPVSTEPVEPEAAANEPVVEPEPEPVSEAEPEPEPEAAPAAEPESAPDAETSPVADMFQNLTPEPEPESKPRPWWSAKRSTPVAPPEEPVAEAAPEPAPEPVPENEPESAPEPVSENEPGSAPESTPDAAEEAPDQPSSDVEAPVSEDEAALAAAAALAATAQAEADAEPEPEPEPLPLRIYEYRFIRVKQNTWDSVEAAILGAGAAAVAEAGGQLYGVWAGQIGLSANQGIVVTVWTDLQAAKRNGGAAINGIGDLSASEALYMEPTARPLDATPPEGPGMFAHRVFEVRRDDADRFVALSDEAWPQFEEVFGTKIFALWRETGHERAYDRLILLTRYADYAAWENSRFWRPEPDPNASDALQRFRERREITADTVVYTTRLAVAATESE